jgi:hypothetical protein
MGVCAKQVAGISCISFISCAQRRSPRRIHAVTFVRVIPDFSSLSPP